MNYIKIFLRITMVAVCIVFSTKTFSQEFSEKQKAVIYNEAIKLLRNYEQFNNQIADNVVDIDQVNKTSQTLIDLFVSRKAIIYNDLDPAHKLSEAYELETYVSNMLLWYPDGMKFSIDFGNIKAGNIISHGNDIYTVDLLTSKHIDGNYLNQQKNTQTEELLYRIAFFQKNKNFESYKIAGVRSSKSKTLADDSKMLAEVKSVTFSEKDMQLIKDQTRALLNDYINFLNLLTDPKESSEDKSYYSISFLGLFKDSTLKVANDIEPDPQSRWIAVNEYEKSLVNSYPEGIRNLGINIDSAEFGKVIPEGNERYYINGYIDKFFSGKYQSKTVFRDNSKYDFKVSFERDENTFKNFKLCSIDKFGVNLYSPTAETATQELPTKPITSLKRNGLFLGFSLGSGIVQLNDPNLNSNSILKWDNKGKVLFNAEVNATWYFYNRIGITAGIGYSRYSANTSLNGSFRNTEYSTDTNGELYLKNVDSAMDSLLSFSYLSIPISITFHSNTDPEKWGFFLETGIVPSFNINSKYKTTGSFSTSGYYEQYPETMQILSSPELGFVSRTNINNIGKADVASFLLTFKACIGVTWPINYFTTVFFGPEFSYSLNNISSSSTYTDAFGNSSAAKKVGISKYGVKFGVSYKF
ncbi:hypothetical protein CYCD_02860 [Tenuifilaceae bacterium CYCD]|nr:hypothetical protein CYCD_02860 [Tenuifilaceae bacterium CYCD]